MTKSKKTTINSSPTSNPSTTPPLDGIGPSSSSVSASFPYIPMKKDSTTTASESPTPPAKKSGDGKGWQPSTTSSSTVTIPKSHTRLGSLSSLRSQPHPASLKRAESLFHAIIFRQSSLRGVMITDVNDERAPWRKDDSLVSPELWSEYQKYPQLTETMLQYGDPTLVGQEVVDELSRYISLARFGETEGNAWKIMKRICGQKPQSRAIVWLNSSGKIERDWTFGELYSRICTFSLYIKNELKLARGDRAILCFVPGLDFFVAFWACLSQGVVAVPVTPIDPFNPRSDVSEKLAAIVSSCSPAAFFTNSEYVNAMEAGRSYLDTMMEGSTDTTTPLPFDLFSQNWFSIDSLDYSATFDPLEPFSDNVGSGYSLAFLQFTSGSTGSPKGVMVGHCNIVSNVAGCTETTRAGKEFDQYRHSIAVSWLPTFHDMGLMGFHIAPLLTGTPVVYFSPLDFLATPTLWLQVLSEWSAKETYRTVMVNGREKQIKEEYRFVTSGGPPFALDLVCKKLALASDSFKKSLDLSRVISIILGAEPIRGVSLLQFADVMEPYGFSANSFMPAYGLAENVLHVCGKKENTYPPTMIQVESQALSEGRLLEYTPDPTKLPLLRGPAKWLVSCGEINSKDPEFWPGMRVKSGHVLVVNPTTLNECTDGTIGELWITGKCVTAGYWNHAAATSAAYSCKINTPCTEVGLANMKSSWYRTGDLGCWYQNNLYITGRLKEMIIVNGTKHYPMDIEESIRLATMDGIAIPKKSISEDTDSPTNSSAGVKKKIYLRPGGILATEMENPATGKNELIVMVELIEPTNDSSSVGGDKPKSGGSSSSSSSDGQMSSSQVKLANTIFKHCQRLPIFLRTPTIKCLARLGARWTKYKKESAVSAAAKAKAAHGGQDSAPVFTANELDLVEKCIRRAVMGRFGIPVAEVILLKPRSILKTSSGKIRRLATCQHLVDGEFVSKILRRSSEKVVGLGKQATVSSAIQWIAKPAISGSDVHQSEVKPTKTQPTHSTTTIKPKPIGKSVTNSKSSSESSVPRSDSEFELVSNSPTSSTSSSSSVSPPAIKSTTNSSPLDFESVKKQVTVILGEELQLDSETILLLSQSFSFDESASLDEYGLDSLTAMKIAGRFTQEFNLLIPISPFMFFSEPTLDGMVKLILRLKDEKFVGKKITSAKEFQANNGANSSTVQPIASKKVAVTQPKQEQKDSVSISEVKSAPATSTKPSHSSSSGSSSSNGYPFIFGLGCCVPGPGAPQNAIMDVMVSDMELPAKKAALFSKIGESAGIDRRYSVLPSIEAIYFGRKGLGNNETVDVRNAIFKSEAPALSLDSARAAIADWGGDLLDITHVVAVTCTGVIVPGLEFQILSGLGLNPNVQRLSVTFMGCFGALSGMKAARAFAMESPANRVLLVCTELCSLHMQLDDRIDNLVGSALFADGSGAMIVGSVPRPGERPLFEMHRNASVIIPDTLDMMAWELTSSGMSIGLGKEIPDAIYRYIDSFSAGMLEGTEAHEVNFDQCLWALHPGGPMILTAISDRLGLSPLHTSSAWTVLRKYGNMSSATLIFVLRELLQQYTEGESLESALPVGCTPFIPALAFGPGLNVEGCLLKYVGGPIGMTATEKQQTE